MNEYGTLRLDPASASGFRLAAGFASGRETVFDTGEHATAPNPVEHLVAALAACCAMDVVGILRKKRLAPASYEVALAGERAESHPRRFTAIALVHRVSGPGITEAVVAEALALSRTKYCSVLHTLDPALRIETRVEVREG